MSDRKTASGSCYLIIAGINKGSETYPIWQLGGFHVRKTKPDLSRNEVAVKLEMELPVALFEKPLLKAGITIDGDVPEIDLTPDTISDIESVIRAQSGLDVRLEVATDD